MQISYSYRQYLSLCVCVLFVHIGMPLSSKNSAIISQCSFEWHKSRFSVFQLTLFFLGETLDFLVFLVFTVFRVV